MKQLLLFCALILSAFLQAQPPEFSPFICGTASSNQLTRFVLVNGQPAEAGADWAGVIDSDGLLVGVAAIQNFTGPTGSGCPSGPGFVMEVYGRDGTNFNNLNCGLNFGEDFLVTIWDDSEGVFYDISETYQYAGGFNAYPAPAGGVCATVNANVFSTLPVTFAGLSAREVAGKVALDWSTASESGNDYFEVQHSTTLGNFVTVGQVDGAGDSHELLDYAFVHGTPAVGTNYYRIKQVDFEGTFTHSGIIPVDVTTVQARAVSLFPNPAAGGYFNLNVGSDWNVDNVGVSIVNAVGRRVMAFRQDVTATRQVTTVDLAAGMYLVRVKGGKQTTTKRLIVR